MQKLERFVLAFWARDGEEIRYNGRCTVAALYTEMALHHWIYVDIALLCTICIWFSLFKT